MNTTKAACDGQWPLFWQLIDAPANFRVRNEAAKFCGTCPVRDTCLPQHVQMGGDDAAWATAIIKELARPKAKPCEHCGKRMEMKPNAGNRRKYCDDVCGNLARTNRLGDIEPEIRKAHAEFTRYRTAKMRAEDIPADIRAGERMYQTLRKRAMRLRTKQEAA